METVPLEKFEEERKNHLLLQIEYIKLLTAIHDFQEKVIDMLPKSNVIQKPTSLAH